MKKSIRDAVEIETIQVDGLGVVTRGIRVQHPHFGSGTVVAIFQFPEYSQTRHSIGIEFDAVGYKPLTPEYAKLQRVDDSTVERPRFSWLSVFGFRKR